MFLFPCVPIDASFRNSRHRFYARRLKRSNVPALFINPVRTRYAFHGYHPFPKYNLGNFRLLSEISFVVPSFVYVFPVHCVQNSSAFVTPNRIPDFFLTNTQCGYCLITVTLIHSTFSVPRVRSVDHVLLFLLPANIPVSEACDTSPAGTLPRLFFP